MPDAWAPLPASVAAGPAVEVARRLIGCTLVSTLGGSLTAGTIVEAEAYGADDPACHGFNGKTERNAAMFGSPGTLYVYRIYGMHFCANVVVGAEGVGEAVLLRAVEPTQGLEAMRERRGDVDDRLLCAGPGRLCKAMAIGIEANATSLVTGPVRLMAGLHQALQEVRATTRIGVTKAADRPWRFCLVGSRYVSRK